MPTVSLTELRQNLFALADRVIETGEPLVIDRRGVRLQLIRVSEPAFVGRLARLASRELVIGDSLRPDESPAQWSGSTSARPRAAEPGVGAYRAPRKKSPRSAR